MPINIFILILIMAVIFLYGALKILGLGVFLIFLAGIGGALYVGYRILKKKYPNLLK